MFVIYNTETFKLFRQNFTNVSYDEERTAKAQFTKFAKSGKLDPNEWKVIEYSKFREIEPMVETVNLMSGKKTMIRASDAGSCVDVGTETYWSM